MEELRQKWNTRYRAQVGQSVTPCQVLSDHAGLLPREGTALDLACGRGGNALLLAKLGLTTSAWDISGVAINELQKMAQTAGLDIDCRVSDVTLKPPAPDSYDVIVVSYFLERDQAGALEQALRPEGLLYFQTFIGEQRDGHGPKNPGFRLKSNELLNLFSRLKLIYYDESGQIIDGECLFIGQKA